MNYIFLCCQNMSTKNYNSMVSSNSKKCLFLCSIWVFEELIKNNGHLSQILIILDWYSPLLIFNSKLEKYRKNTENLAINVFLVTINSYRFSEHFMLLVCTYGARMVSRFIYFPRFSLFFFVY